eukprot:5816312-Karenia_brevis.AAC.1
MKGCEVRGERIILADAEPELHAVQVGLPTCLQYMPAALLLRARQADWILPSAYLPWLPHDFDRRGLFLLRPTTDYFTMTTLAGKSVQVRRTQFSVAPASSRIVYNAQGEGFDAIIVDLARPPSMSAEVHWLACYVMLSRARSLEGLLILRLASRSELSA